MLAARVIFIAGTLKVHGIVYMLLNESNNGRAFVLTKALFYLFS